MWCRKYTITEKACIKFISISCVSEQYQSKNLNNLYPALIQSWQQLQNCNGMNQSIGALFSTSRTDYCTCGQFSYLHSPDQWSHCWRSQASQTNSTVHSISHNQFNNMFQQSCSQRFFSPSLSLSLPHSYFKSLYPLTAQHSISACFFVVVFLLSGPISSMSHEYFAITRLFTTKSCKIVTQWCY